VTPPAGERVAALDCGTNSTRLLVAEPDGDGGFRTLERRMVITRLGQGVDASGHLHPAAIGRTLDVLGDYRALMDDLGVAPGHTRVTATSAARDAANRSDFFGPAAAVVGAEPELLSGEDEGRLTFLGATTGLDPAQGPFVVVDIGGGSTEFSLADGSMSVDIGCVRFTELYLESDPPAPEELHACITVTTEHLKDVVRELPGVSAAKTFVGVAGTVSTVAAVEIGLPAYDRDRIHHFSLTHEAAEDVFRTLATEPRADRIHNPGLEEARADVIVGGCCILVAIFRHFGLDRMLVSEADILDGLVLSMLDGDG
jgi:exopolyphosphatase/guanosine-5'-triphosphate,3'-diphosphate pyrophosphatase